MVKQIELGKPSQLSTLTLWESWKKVVTNFKGNKLTEYQGLRGSGIRSGWVIIRCILVKKFQVKILFLEAKFRDRKFAYKNESLFMKLITLVISCISFVSASAQQESSSVFDKVGIFISMNYDHLKLSTVSWDNYKITDEVNSLTADDKIGFSIGLAYFIELNKNFTLRPQSIISFQSNQLDYDFVILNDHQEAIQPVHLELPVHFIYTSRSDKYFMPSLVMGLRGIYDVSEKKDGQKLTLKKSNFAFDIGGGLDVHLKNFNMRPELIVSIGMRNINTFQNDIYHKAIAGMVREKISFGVSFYQNKKHGS